MEIYRVTLGEVRTPDGRRVSPQLVVGFTSHALREDYRERKRLHLEKAPENFRVATGLEYLARARAGPSGSF
jgi:hypothetical protein